MAIINVGGRDYGLAASGNVYTAINTTPGTAIVGHAAPTTLDKTKALLHLYNGGSKIIQPIGLRLKLENAGTAAVTVAFTQELDKGPTRYSSGGSEITPVGTNLSSGSSGAKMYFGAATLITSTGAARLVGHARYRNVIGVVEDTYLFSWGAPASGPITNLTTLSTGVSSIGINYPAIVINPGEQFAIYQWAGSQSAGYQFEFQFDFLEG
jgi:hypothetical protein